MSTQPDKKTLALPRLRDLGVIAFVVVLALGVAHRADSIAHTRSRLTTDRALFARYATGLRGSFAKVVVTHRRASDLACARRRTHRYRVCIVVRRGQVVRAYEKKVAS
jgi:hypothetical protein